MADSGVSRREDVGRDVSGNAKRKSGRKTEKRKRAMMMMMMMMMMLMMMITMKLK